MVRLRLSPGLPERLPLTVDVLVNDSPVASLTLQAHPAWYDLYVPRKLNPDGEIRIQLQSPTFRPLRDPRDLGVAVMGIEMKPLGSDGWFSSATVPPWKEFILLLGTVACAVTLSFWIGAGWLSVVVGITLALVEGYLVASHRLALTPYAAPLFLVSGMLLLIAVAGWWVVRHPPVLAGVATLGACFSVVSFGIAAWPLFLGSGRAVDLGILWEGAHRVLARKELYDMGAILTNHMGAVYKVPPLQAILLLPTTSLPFGAVKIIWRWLSLLSAAATLVAVGRSYLTGFRASHILGFVATVIAFRPVFDTLNYGQVDLFLLACLGGFLVLQRSQFRWLGGALVAMAGILKLYPLAFAALMAARREWRSLGGFVLGLLVLMLIAVPFVGLDTLITYTTKVIPNIGDGTAWVENQTLNGFISRFYASELASKPGPTNALVQTATYLGAIIFLGVPLILAWLHRGRPDADLEYGFFLTGLLLAIPAAWIHYETVLLLPFLALIFKYGPSVAQHRILVFTVATSYLLITFGNAWSFGPLVGPLNLPVYTGTVHQGLWKLVLSYKFYGVVLLWFALLAVRLRLGQPVIQLRSAG
jgi:hypothetical protein